METPWLKEAIINNANWCDAMAAAHGVATDLTDDVWFTSYGMPSFYPNVITLQKGIQINRLVESISQKLPAGWGVKDSFDDLGLDGLGFRSALRAHWYCRPPGKYQPKRKKPKYDIKIVNNVADLQCWVSGWGLGDGIFNTSLVADGCVQLMYATQGCEVVSGLAINHSVNSVGISNIFGAEDALLECLDTVVGAHSMKGIVGYGDESEIAALSGFGFEKIGDLRIWLKN